MKTVRSIAICGVTFVLMLGFQNCAPSESSSPNTVMAASELSTGGSNHNQSGNTDPGWNWPFTGNTGNSGGNGGGGFPGNSNNGNGNGNSGNSSGGSQLGGQLGQVSQKVCDVVTQLESQIGSQLGGSLPNSFLGSRLCSIVDQVMTKLENTLGGLNLGPLNGLNGLNGLIDSILAKIGVKIGKNAVFIPGAGPGTLPRVTCVDCKEALVVIEAYSARAPNNVLAPFIPYIEELQRTGYRSSVSDLPGFNEAWLMAEKDDRFVAAVLSLL